MSILDNRSAIKQLDPSNYLSHLFDIPEQLVDGFALGDSIRVPALYAQAKQVILLVSPETLSVAHSLEAIALNYARVPVLIVCDYTVPHWVSSDTLVIAIDYNGVNDQVLTAFQDAAARRARLLAFSVEGNLAKEARRFRVPHIPFNYGAPARAAYYYMFACLAALFRRLDFAELKESTVTEASVLSRSLLENIGPDVPLYQNNAKQLAEKIATRKAIIVGSGPLKGIALKWQMTIAALGKIIVTSSCLSEFNDTIINGLGYHQKFADAPVVAMLQSKYDHPRNKLQQTLTYQVAQAQKIVYEQIFMHPSGSLFGELVLSSILGDFVGYYAALMLHNDPSKLEVTDFIREQLRTTQTD